MISAKVIAHSKAPNGEKVATLEVVFPRYILAELNTHRVLSKNSASSRAIPFAKMVKEVQENPFIPYAWQKDHKGMQGNEYITDKRCIEGNIELWLQARDEAIAIADVLNNTCYVTKQLANRLLEPFMYHKVLVSGTEWENFFNLRCPSYTFHDDEHKHDTHNEEGEYTFRSRKEAIKSLGADNPVEFSEGNVPLGELSLLQWLSVNTGQADIHMMFLAEAIYDAINESTPKELKEGEWHIPYGNDIDIEKVQSTNYIVPYSNDNEQYKENVQEAIRRIAIARCARLSYQTLGDNPEINYEKDLQLYEVLSKSGHWSPFEHVAKVMTQENYLSYIKGKAKGGNITDIDSYFEDNSVGWCRNFKGFIQYRELLD